MTKATIIKVIGTIASGILAGGSLAFPPQYRDLALAIAAATLTALHIPRPGDVKAAS
jgi:hypothetical protein